MYSDIGNVFLNNIRAIRLYINSVEQTMDNPFSDKSIENENTLAAVLIYIVTKAKECGINLSDTSQSFEYMPQEDINDIINELERLAQGMECDNFYRYLPKGIKREYRALEAREKQKEILYRGSLLLLVTYFENLVAGVLRENFVKYPQRIALNEKSVSYRVLTEVNDIEEIKDILIDQEVTNKMYESLSDWKNYF